MAKAENNCTLEDIGRVLGTYFPVGESHKTPWWPAMAESLLGQRDEVEYVLSLLGRARTEDNMPVTESLTSLLDQMQPLVTARSRQNPKIAEITALPRSHALGPDQQQALRQWLQELGTPCHCVGLFADVYALGLRLAGTEHDAKGEGTSSESGETAKKKEKTKHGTKRKNATEEAAVRV